MNKKKTIIISSSVVFIILIICMFSLFPGGKRTDVYLTDYSVSEDGSKMTLNISVMSSAGYVKSLKVKQGGDNKYITFYSTFGLNNKFGSKDKFEIDLKPTCEDIYFYSGDGGYKLVLNKEDDTNKWTIVK